ncbi:DUF3017 domain-containing protein [Rhodococcus sp. H29-C3]|uniref:DUF3017 domain-containing protein n=1 Tax=Rhodococcus sp. H29-C3 TaxID=3046307 RepID=UPI0024BA4D1F|nr:DUF3017 domain-containing protein [Rhodococcus sp. H29-C3]MDJ0361725.1 DUF3017 domain-containing protein [Rhodococcus sp. H29-C3]
MWSQIRRNLPLVIVLVIIAAALVLVLADRWRRGAFVFGVATIAAAGFRLCMPEKSVGLLQVRSRTFDVSAMALVGGAIVLLSASIDPLGTD